VAGEATTRIVVLRKIEQKMYTAATGNVINLSSSGVAAISVADGEHDTSQKIFANAHYS
jgi:hypothetical protein